MGRCILEHRDAIIAEWEAQSRVEHPRAGEAERLALRNSLPEFLTALGRALSEGGSASIPPSFAVEHGMQRWRIGWDVAAVCRDFMILRRVLVKRMSQSVELSTDEVLAIAVALDEAVVQSVQAHATHRDHELHERIENLQRKNYELKRFAHMVAHEVRSPLGLVTLAANALQRRISSLPADARAQLDDAGEQLSLIGEARSQIVEIVETLVCFADGEGDSLILEDDVQLAEVFDHAVEHLKYFIESSDASITRGDLPAVRGNPVALRAVFQNLVENALKYCGDQAPRVRVTASEETTESGQAYWAIAFRDDGIGIDDKDQDRIFRLLSRVNVQERIPGSGVGLALCRRVAEQHGGSMHVQSAPGLGSTFTLRLPRLDDDSKGRASQGPGSEVTKK